MIEVPDDAELEPEGPPVPVRYRDEDLLVIAKPPGLVTHPTENRSRPMRVRCTGRRLDWVPGQAVHDRPARRAAGARWSS